MKKREEGFALLYTLVVFFVVALLGMATLFVTEASLRRNDISAERQQALLTAKSVAEAVRTYLDSSDNSYINQVTFLASLASEGTNSYTIDATLAESDRYNLAIEKQDENTLKITAEGFYENQTAIATAYVKIQRDLSQEGTGIPIEGLENTGTIAFTGMVGSGKIYVASNRTMFVNSSTTVTPNPLGENRTTDFDFVSRGGIDVTQLVTVRNVYTGGDFITRGISGGSFIQKIYALGNVNVQDNLAIGYTDGFVPAAIHEGGIVAGGNVTLKRSGGMTNAFTGNIFSGGTVDIQFPTENIFNSNWIVAEGDINITLSSTVEPPAGLRIVPLNGRLNVSFWNETIRNKWLAHEVTDPNEKERMRQELNRQLAIAEVNTIQTEEQRNQVILLQEEIMRNIIQAEIPREQETPVRNVNGHWGTNALLESHEANYILTNSGSSTIGTLTIRADRDVDIYLQGINQIVHGIRVENKSASPIPPRVRLFVDNTLEIRLGAETIGDPDFYIMSSGTGTVMIRGDNAFFHGHVIAPIANVSFPNGDMTMNGAILAGSLDIASSHIKLLSPDLDFQAMFDDWHWE